MTDPTDINTVRASRQGSPMFAHCGDCGGYGWHIICVMASDKPVVSTLVCMLCEQSRDVVYGVVQFGNGKP